MQKEMRIDNTCRWSIKVKESCVRWFRVFTSRPEGLGAIEKRRSSYGPWIIQECWGLQYRIYQIFSDPSKTDGDSQCLHGKTE